MTPDRAFYLAGEQAKATETVTGHAHAAVNCMASGSTKAKAKERISEVREMCAGFAGLTFGLMPFTLEYREDMTEAELRAWAKALVDTLNGA